MITSLLAAVLWASPCAHISIEARVAEDLRTLTGTLTCELSTPAPEEVVVWNYPATLGDGSHLDDVETSWLYPEGYSAARLLVSVGGRALPEVPSLPLRLRPEDGGVLRLEFSTRVPIRNGSFTCHRGSLYLAGGWHPLLGSKGASPYLPTPLSYVLEVPGRVQGVVGVQPVRRGDRAVSRVSGRFYGSSLPMVLTPELRVTALESGVIFSPGPRRRRSPPPALEDAFQYRDDVALERLSATLEDGARWAAAEGLSTPPVGVVVAPLRRRLVERSDAGLVVSDRAFHLLGVERFLKFHRIRVWGEQLRYYVARSVEGREPPEHAAQHGELVSAALLERWVRSAYGEAEYAPDVLEPFAIIPEIDTLIYAPQIPFRETYYKAIYDEGAGGDLPYEFATGRNFGGLLYEKLLDLVGPEKAQDLVSTYLGSTRRLGEVIVAELGADVWEALEGWRGEYPRVDYALGAVEHTNGVATVEVVAAGPDSERVNEPLVVRLTTEAGEVVHGTRQGPGALTFAVDSAPAEVVLDPNNRLVELHRTPGEDPHYNNQLSPNWRFLLNNLSGLMSVTDGQLMGSVNFSLRQLHELRWRYQLAGYASPSAFGLSLGTSYGFGEQITPLWLAERVGLLVSANQLRRDTPRAEAGQEVSAGVYYRYDTRLSPFSSFRGAGLSARVSGSYSQTESGQDYLFSQVSLSGLKIWQWGARQALVARLRGDVQWGESPSQRGFRLGGPYLGGRGFEMSGVRGSRRAVATLEHRHGLVSGRRTDFGGLWTLTGIEGAFFADGVYLEGASESEPGASLCGERLFADVGYGVRFLVDLLSVSPSALVVDVGVPVTRCGMVEDASPVTVYVSFVQSLLSF